MQTRNKTHNIEILFSLALFAVFLFCAVFVILTGVNVYKTSVEKSDENYRLRTTLSYISEKVKASDSNGNIDLYEFEDGTGALSIASVINDTNYHTYIYTLDGYMYELFIKDDLKADPQMGEKLLESGSLTFSKKDNGLIKVSLIDAKEKETFIYVHPSSMGGNV